MPSPTPRLLNRIRHDFAPDAAVEVVSRLAGLTENEYGLQDPERLQAALVLAADGDLSRFHELIKLLRLDWRDVLVAGGLAQGDWPVRLRDDLPDPAGTGAVAPLSTPDADATLPAPGG